MTIRFVIAGQGTVGREIAEDMAALGLAPDIVVAPASGGGLIAGVATAVKARFPQADAHRRRARGFDDHARRCAPESAKPHHAEGRTICDALMASIPGEITFAINSQLLAQGVTASDEEVGAAVAFAFRELKLVVEPGGAVGLAALLAGRIDVARQECRHRAVGRQCRCGSVREADRLSSRSGKQRDLLGLAHAPDRRQRIGRRSRGLSQDSIGDQRRAKRRFRLQRRLEATASRGRFNGRHDLGCDRCFA